MFSFFNRKKHSPGDSPEDTSASSNQQPEDEYVVVNKQGPSDPKTNNPVYPSLTSNSEEKGGWPFPFPVYPPGNSVLPVLQKKEVSFLQGVPFSLSKELSANDNSEMISIQISEIMAYMTGRMQVQSMDYDFSVEKSVLLENCS